MKDNLVSQVVKTVHPLLIDKKYIVSVTLTDIKGNKITLDADQVSKLEDRTYMARMEHMAVHLDIPSLMRDFVKSYIEFNEGNDDGASSTIPDGED